MISGLLRLALALIVVIHHLSSFGVGKACVYLFFVLSGYWVARMWRDKYSRLERPWRTFVLARFLRIWPLFLICNMVAILMLDAMGRPMPSACSADIGVACLRSALGNLLLLGYTGMPDRALGPAWSLDIELQFYLVAPMLIAWLRQRGAGLWAWSAAIVGVALLATWWWPDSLPQYLPFFVLGILAAGGRVRFGRRAALASGFASTALLAFGLLTHVGRDLIFTGAVPGPLSQFNESFNVLLAVLAAPGALHLATRELGTRGASLGDLAFVVYVVHWIPVTLVNTYYGSLPAPQRLPYVAGAMFATLAIAWAMWRWIDQPLERWRRLLARPAATTAAAPAPSPRTGSGRVDGVVHARAPRQAVSVEQGERG